MGDVEKVAKRGLRVFSGDLSGEKKATQAIEKPVRTGASSVRRDTARQIAEAQKKEETKLLQTESDIARRKAGVSARAGGRGSLIRSSPSGLATNLGGT